MRPALLAALALLGAGCLAPAAILPPPDALVEARLTPATERASEVSIAAHGAVVLAAANSQGGFGVYRSEDGGRTWTAARFEASQVAPPAGAAPRFQRVGDPALAFGPDGTAYLAGLAIVPTSAVFVASSTDGGRTWRDVVVADESDLATEFNDKEWLAVSPTTGTLVLAWQKEPAMDTLRSVEALAGGRADLDVGDIVVARSDDGGRSWSEPQRVSAGRHNNGTQVAFTSEGHAHLLWVNYETSTLDVSTSGDDGRTWSTPRAVAQIAVAPSLPGFERMHTLPALAAGPGGALLAAWHDARAGEEDVDVYAIASADRGGTWSAPVRVGANATRGHQLYPWAALDAEGRAHVSFYDALDEGAAPSFRYSVATAPDLALGFGAPRPLATAASSPFATPARAERSLGDYTGLVALPDALVAAWADNRGERDQVYAARAPLTPPR